MSPLNTNRLLVALIVAFGFLTFFWSFISVEPPVAGKTRWSCLTIVQQMYRGTLPTPVCERCGEPEVRALVALPFTVALNYVCMAAALAAISLGKPAKTLIGIALFGTCSSLSFRSIATRLEFQGTFYGISRQGHVHSINLFVAHVVVFVALFLVALDMRDKERGDH